MGQRQSAPAGRAALPSTGGTVAAAVEEARTWPAAHLPAKARGEIGLPDLLRELGVEALDKLVAKLGRQRSISAARLACRALRDTVDGSTVALRLSVKDVDRDAVRGAPPPLARWPRLRRLHVHADADEDNSEYEDSFLLVLPIARMAPGAAQRLAELHLSAAPHSLAGAEAAVALLPPYLPQLHVLDMRGLASCFSRSLTQELMYRALATLPQLEELCLPGCECLNGIGELAASGGSRLRRLVVVVPLGNGDARALSEGAAAGIGRLSQLQRLELSACAPAPPEQGQGGAFTGGFSALLKHLPPSLEELVVGHISHVAAPAEDAEEVNDGVRKFRAAFHGGRMQSFRVGQPDVQLCSFACLAADLVASGTAQRLERASVDSLYWDDAENAPLTPAQLQAIRSLRRCCASFHLGRLRLYALPTEAFFVGLWDALSKPQQLEVCPFVDLWSPELLVVRLDATPAEGKGAAAALGGAAAREGGLAAALPAAAGAMPQRLPALGSLLRAAASTLQRLPGVSAAPPLPPGVGAFHAVLVTGLAEALLADAEALGAWVDDLASRAAGASTEPAARMRVVRYLVVPPAGAVVVVLDTAQDAAAVQEAATQLAAGALLEACMFLVGSFPIFLPGLLLRALGEVLSSEWGPRMLAAGRSEEARLVRWLWAVVAGLKEVYVK